MRSSVSAWRYCLLPDAKPELPEAEAEPPKPAPSVGPSLMAMVQGFAQSLGLEVRHVVGAVVFRIVAIVLILTSAMFLMVAGLLQLALALAHACAQWFAAPILGEVVAGIALVTFASLGMWLTWRRVRH